MSNEFPFANPSPWPVAWPYWMQNVPFRASAPAAQDDAGDQDASLSNRGILGLLTSPRDASSSDLSGFATAPAPGGILGSLGQRIGAQTDTDRLPQIWPLHPLQALGFGGGDQLQHDPWRADARSGITASYPHFPSPWVGFAPAAQYENTPRSFDATLLGQGPEAPSSGENRVQLAGMDTPFPGWRPPFPAFPFPGTPEWTEH